MCVWEGGASIGVSFAPVEWHNSSFPVCSGLDWHRQSPFPLHWRLSATGHPQCPCCWHLYPKWTAVCSQGKPGLGQKSVLPVECQKLIGIHGSIGRLHCVPLACEEVEQCWQSLSQSACSSCRDRGIVELPWHRPISYLLNLAGISCYSLSWHHVTQEVHLALQKWTFHRLQFQVAIA